MKIWTSFKKKLVVRSWRVPYSQNIVIYNHFFFQILNSGHSFFLLLSLKIIQRTSTINTQQVISKNFIVTVPI